MQEEGSIVLANETFSTEDILVFREAKVGTEAISDRFYSIWALYTSISRARS